MPGSASGISEEIWTYVRTGTSKHTYICEYLQFG